MHGLQVIQVPNYPVYLKHEIHKIQSLGPFFFEVWLSLTSPGSFLVVF